LIVITGSMGAGKSAVLGEASDLLALRGIVHAAIDLDGLGLAHLPSSAPSDDAMYENLRSVCENYAARGVRNFLVARAIENEAQLNRCREIIPAANTAVCRLVASAETMKRRVEIREAGVSQRDYVARVTKLNAILDGAQLEDFSVINEDRSLTEVALEMLRKAGWIAN
jgi:hypothetical protein